jgi:hypothetical protein
MKIKAFLAQAVAGLVLCGLFAPGASAEESREVTFCNGNQMSSTEQAWINARWHEGSIEGEAQAEAEIIDAVRAGVLRPCAVALIPISEMVEVSNAILACLDPAHDPRNATWNRADAERCVAPWAAGNAADTSRKHRRSKRKKRHPAKERHRSFQSGAGIALAR